MVYIYNVFYLFRQLSVSIDTTFIIDLCTIFIYKLFDLLCIYLFPLQGIAVHSYTTVLHRAQRDALPLSPNRLSVSLSLCLSVSLSARRGRGAECQRTEHLFTT